MNLILLDETVKDDMLRDSSSFTLTYLLGRCFYVETVSMARELVKSYALSRCASFLLTFIVVSSPQAIKGFHVLFRTCPFLNQQRATRLTNFRCNVIILIATQRTLMEMVEILFVELY